MKTSYKSINKIAIYNLLGPVLLNGISFFTVPIFTRLLNPSGFGKVSVYSVWVQILTIFIGLQTSGTIATAKIYIPDNEQKKYYSSMAGLSAITFTFIAIITFIFISPLVQLLEFSQTIILIMLLHGFGSYLVSFYSMILIYEKRAKENFILTTSIAILTSVFSVILVVLTPSIVDKYIARIIGMSVPYILIGIGIFCSITAYDAQSILSVKYWNFALPLCLPLIFHALGHVILGQTDKIMLQKLAVDDDLVGIYSFGVTLTHILNVVWSALNNTWVPFYYDDMKCGLVSLIMQRSKNYIILFTGLVSGFLLISPEVVTLMSSKDYMPILPIIPIMTISMYMVFLYSFPVNYQFYCKKTSFIALGTVGAALMNILLNWILIPNFGMTGAAIATALSYICLFIFHHIIASFVIKGDYTYKISVFLPSMFIVLSMILIYYVLLNEIVIRWIIATFVGIFLLLRLWKTKTIF